MRRQLRISREGLDQRPAGLQAKTVQDQRFPRDYSRQFVGLVKKMKEKAGLGALVDTREMRDLLAVVHLHEA